MCLCLETTFTEANFLDMLLVFLGFQVIADGKYGLFSVLSLGISVCFLL